MTIVSSCSKESKIGYFLGLHNNIINELDPDVAPDVYEIRIQIHKQCGWIRISIDQYYIIIINGFLAPDGTNFVKHFDVYLIFLRFFGIPIGKFPCLILDPLDPDSYGASMRT